MLAKRNGRIVLKDEGPVHELDIVEVETERGREQRLGRCKLCGDPGLNWDKPCPRAVVPPLDQCEWSSQGGPCTAEGAVLFDDGLWLCQMHAQMVLSVQDDDIGAS